MRWLVKIAALGFGFGFGGLCWAVPPEKSLGIDAIRAYEGTWTITVDNYDTAESKASHDKKTLHNECWKSGGYFACNQFVDGESKVLLVFTYNESKNEYTTYQIPLVGGEPGSGKLLIDGNVWTYPWQVGEGDKTTYFRVVNTFESPDKIEFRQEFSPDRVHWTVMGRGLETKSSPR